MARPMILIKHSLLHKLSEETTQGVPVSLVIRKYSLDITGPTLTRLLSYYATSQAQSTPQQVKQTILGSLFPEWLASTDNDVAIQCSNEYRYRGRMPLGHWERIQDNTDEQ